MGLFLQRDSKKCTAFSLTCHYPLLETSSPSPVPGSHCCRNFDMLSGMHAEVSATDVFMTSMLLVSLSCHFLSLCFADVVTMHIFSVGTSAQQLDATFSTNASLEIFEFDLSDPSLDMKSCATFSSSHRYEIQP